MGKGKGKGKGKVRGKGKGKGAKRLWDLRPPPRTPPMYDAAKIVRRTHHARYCTKLLCPASKQGTVLPPHPVPCVVPLVPCVHSGGN